MGTLAAGLLGSGFTTKGVIRAGEGVIKAGEDLQWCPILLKNKKNSQWTYI